MKKCKIGLFAVSVFIAAACERFVEIGLPKDQLVSETVFADSSSAEAAIFGLYIGLNGSITGVGSGGMTLMMGLAADELIPNGASQAYNEFYSNRIGVENSANATLWTTAYQTIYRANSISESLDASPFLSQSLKDRLMAEAFTIRAFTYFQLVNVYGDVPLILNTDYHLNRLIPRAAVSEIYQQIASDLEFARENMPLPTEKPLDVDRVSYYAATALLAKVKLFMGEFEEAERYSTEVIESGVFALMPDVTEVFQVGSSEIIWSLAATSTSRQTTEAFEFVPRTAAAIPRYLIADGLIGIFGPSDQRKKWIGNKITSSGEYWFPNKYRTTSASQVPKENYVYLRLAEQYLIRAEARANQNGPDGFEGAIADVETIRSRAGIDDPLSIEDRQGLLDAILEERRRELFAEWGNRWTDLKRFNRTADVLQSVKQNWNPAAILNPIPIQEINANPRLIQNEGY